ncbi:TPA: hypothetical protein NNM78_000474 [Pseudomonas aeruginosa]|nr:hypothetical protein [Pseudomonas aeruginosa]
MTESKICTCPSGDGSLRWPCPKHPAVEQAGGDERAAFEAAFAAMGRPVCRADYDQDAYGTPFDDGGWTGWQARAALAQPSPAQAEQAEGAHVPDEVFAGVFAEWWEEEGQYCRAGGGDYERTFAFQAWRHLYPLLLQARAALAQTHPSPAPTLRAAIDVANVRFEVPVAKWGTNLVGEEEQPKVVARVDGTDEDWFIQPEDETELHNEGLLFAGCELGRMIDFDRIVGELRDELESERKRVNIYVNNNRIRQDNERLRAELRAALARVAEMERQEPVATVAKVPGEDWNSLDFHRDLQHMQPGTKLYAAPVAQAQHSVPGDIMRDAQRYRWLRDQQFYFSFSTENSDAGISSCTAGMSSRFKNLSWVDAAIDSAIAAAPGKEGV